MEKILIGVLESNKPLSVKQAFVKQVSKVGQQKTEYKDYCNFLKGCFDYLFHKDEEKLDEFSITSIKSLLKVWIMHHEKMAETFLELEILKKPLKDMSMADKLRHVTRLKYSLEGIQEYHQSSSLVVTGLVGSYLFNSFVCIDSLELLAMFSSIFKQNPIIMPSGLDTESKLCMTKIVLNVVTSTPFSLVYTKTEKSAQSNTIHLREVYELFSMQMLNDFQLMKKTSHYLLQLLSDTSRNPSINLAYFLPCLKLEYLVADIEEILMSNISNELLTVTLERMIDWLCYPDQSILVDNWILQFMKSLMKFHKYDVVFSVAENKAKQVCNLLFFPMMRKSALSALTFIMMSYLHSPKLFHLVAPIFTKLFEHLKKTEQEETKQTCHVLAELIHTLMYHFPGYPDIYTELLTVVKEYPKPSEINMRKWLNASSAITKVDISHGILHQKKSETGKVGLENLGNTCFMNSVIQALYNLSHVKREILTQSYAFNSVSASFQNLLAMLQNSERPAIAPRSFNKLSRPTWFLEGSQQDCSEYLKILLDTIQQENGDSNDNVNDLCTGDINTVVECFQCRSLSCRTEKFNDLPLSFPCSIQEPCADGGGFTLKGGDLSDRMDRKTHFNIADISDVEMDISPDVSESAAGDVNINAGNSKPMSVVSMLNTYFLPEDLTGNNQYFCEKCACLQNARKYVNVVKFPQYLFLTLKRFTFDVQTQKRSKILQTIEYESNFTICRDCEGCNRTRLVASDDDIQDKAAVIFQNNDTCVFTTSSDCQSDDKYRIISIIVHSGYSSDNGHYYSYNCQYSGDNTPMWYLMNDTRVSWAPVDFLSNLGNNFPRDTPYICIYERYGDNVEHLNDVKLSENLQLMVTLDNQKYIQELNAQKHKTQNSFVIPRYNDDEDDSNAGGGGVGPCGGGGFGGPGVQSGKFVF